MGKEEGGKGGVVAFDVQSGKVVEEWKGGGGWGGGTERGKGDASRVRGRGCDGRQGVARRGRK